MAFLGVYRAVYDYRAQSEEELDIRDGDLLLLLEKSAEDDWWRCKKKAVSEDDDEPEGLVPNNYVEEAQPLYRAKALYDYTQQTDEELSFEEGRVLDVFDTNDPDWTLVGDRTRNEYGFAPAIYMEKTAGAAAAPQTAPAAPAAPPMPARPNPPPDHIPGESYDDDYIPGEVPPPHRAASSGANPAAALAGIIAQRTGGGEPSAPPAMPQRAMASPPMPTQQQYTPEESEEEAPPPKPQRPQSQSGPPPSAAPQTQYASTSRAAEHTAAIPSPQYNRSVAPTHDYNEDGYLPSSPGGFHLYNVHEMVSHMGKNKKMPTTLGLNVARGIITISPAKSRDGPQQEWTADKLTHYSIEGKHVFVELVRPSKSVDFHAGAKDTAQEIVASLGELAGASRAEGLREVWAAGQSGTSGSGQKTGKMLYEFMAQGDDEVTVAVGDEVVVLDDRKSDEWWQVRRLKNGKSGVVPSSYVEITGTIPGTSESVAGLNAARQTVAQNQLEEERLTKEAVRRNQSTTDSSIPDRSSSLAGESRRQSVRQDKRSNSSKDAPKSKPNSTKLRTWTDRSGTFKVDAEFIGLRDGKIHLHKLNGVKIAVPVNKMSVEDLEYVERATGASLDEDKPLSDIKRRNTAKDKDRNKDRDGAGASVSKEPEYDWFDFFLQCGVNPQICERYANAFHKDQMGPEVLPEVNEPLLRTLGLKEGDILRVMKFLDVKYDRLKSPATTPAPEMNGNKAEGGLFAGPGGALKNNTRKGRPAPALQTSDSVDADTFRQQTGSPAAEGARETPLASAPKRAPSSGFDDDAWDVKPARTVQDKAPTPEPPKPVEPPGPRVNDDIAQLSLASPPLQPTPAPAPAPAQQPQPTAQAPTSPPPQATPQGANQEIFNKIASLAPARQRPAPPPQMQSVGALAPPPRAASAPGFQPQQQFGAMPLQAQLTGYQPQHMPMGYQQTGFIPQQTGFGGFQGPNGQMMPPRPSGVQGLQQNFPALQPQPTGQFGVQQYLTGGNQQNFQQQQQQQQPNYQQAMINGQQTGSPFADPPRQPFQPVASGLQNSFTPQQTGFGNMQQPSFQYSSPTGMPNGFGQNGYGQPPQQPQQFQPAPQLPPQQTGGVLGPGTTVAPLVAQKTGPAPPVRFGVQNEANKLRPQPTGRANLANATPQNPFGF